MTVVAIILLVLIVARTLIWVAELMSGRQAYSHDEAVEMALQDIEAMGHGKIAAELRHRINTEESA